jgi:hypothetical protein
MKRIIRTALAIGAVAFTAAGAAAQTAAPSAGLLPLTPMDRIQIEQLIARYAYALDTGGRNGYDYADLFTADGVFVGMNQGQAGRSFRGRDTLAALARGGARNPNFVSHYITNIVVEPTAEGARGREYAIIADLGGNGSKGTFTHGGFYEDTYVKTPDGWRFKTRVFYGSESGATPKQKQNDPMKAPAAPTQAAGNPAPAPVAKATGLRNLTADDYIEIKQLVSRYPYALDTGNNNGYDYADLFTADAEFSRPLTKGRENFAKLALAQPHTPNYVRHYITNHVIEPTADGAIGKDYLMVLDIGEGGKPSSIFVGGHYEDIYEKTDAGWKFKRREFIPSRKADAAPPAGPAAPRPQQ